jgi:ribose/xylose/arabinose/galactoside ABC-type transport system permease subunit
VTAFVATLNQRRRRLAPSTAGFVVVYLLIAGLVVYASAAEPVFRTTENLVNVLQQSIVLGLVSIGMTLVVLSGGIDFSVGAVVKVTMIVSAIVMNGHDSMIVPAAAAALGIGLGVGLVNGLIVTRLNAAPFIVTFGTATILRGIALTISTAPIGLAANSFLQLYDAGFEAPGIGRVPWAVVGSAVVWAAAWVVAARTRFGRRLYAVGGDEEVARVAGIHVRRTRVAAYAISGLLASLAGLYLLATSSIGDPTAGDNLEFDAIAAVALGGTSLYGGVGGIVGTLGGVLLLTLVNNVFDLLQISSWYQGMLKGAIILLAVAVYRQRRR